MRWAKANTRRSSKFDAVSSAAEEFAFRSTRRNACSTLFCLSRRNAEANVCDSTRNAQPFRRANDFDRTSSNKNPTATSADREDKL